jgi:hypothetical protein
MYPDILLLSARVHAVIQAKDKCRDRGRGLKEEKGRRQEEDWDKKRRRDSLIGRQDINRFQSLPNPIPSFITPFIS